MEINILLGLYFDYVYVRFDKKYLNICIKRIFFVFQFYFCFYNNLLNFNLNDVDQYYICFEIIFEYGIN